MQQLHLIRMIIRKLLKCSKTRTLILKFKKKPTRNIIMSLWNLLIRWKESKYISTSAYKQLMYSDGILPKAYGLPKIHKQDYPF